MNRVPKAAWCLFTLILVGIPTLALANNSVSLIRTPVSIHKSKDFCFQQKGQATYYQVSLWFAGPTSGTVQVDGKLLDSFPPATVRYIQDSGSFGSGMHKITLTVDPAGTSGNVPNLFPVLSCGKTGRGPGTGAKASTSSENDAEIIKKLDDLQKRVSALEVRVFGKAQAATQASVSHASKNETVEEKINRIELEMTETLKNVAQWKKQIDALRKPTK